MKFSYEPKLSLKLSGVSHDIAKDAIEDLLDLPESQPSYDELAEIRRTLILNLGQLLLGDN